MVSVIAEFSLSLLSPFSCPLRRSGAGVSESIRLTSGSPSGDIQKASDMTVAPGFQQAPLGITFDRFVRACVVIKTLTEAFSGVRPLSSNCGKLAQSDCAFFHLFPLDSLIQTAMDGFRCTLLSFFLTFSPCLLLLGVGHPDTTGTFPVSLPLLFRAKWRRWGGTFRCAPQLLERSTSLTAASFTVTTTNSCRRCSACPKGVSTCGVERLQLGMALHVSYTADASYGCMEHKLNLCM